MCFTASSDDERQTASRQVMLESSYKIITMTIMVEAVTVFLLCPVLVC